MIQSTHITIAMGHRLKDYAGDCRNVHGHNWRITIEIDGRPRPDGMIMEFAELKERLTRVAKRLDHRTLLQEGDPLIGIMEPYTKLVVLNKPPTTENIASLLMNVAFDAGIAAQRIIVAETDNNIVVATGVDRSVRVLAWGDYS